MRFEDFKAGNWKQQFQYKSFAPAAVNTEWSWEDARINVLLEDATRALGELNAYTRIVPDVDLFLPIKMTCRIFSPTWKRSGTMKTYRFLI